MFREKYNPLKNKRGYLYLRESEYIRDKRTYKKKPSKLGDGSATKQRGKYTVKKDTYLGKINEVEIKNILTFKDYIENILKKDFLEYKIKINFEKLIDDFIDYILYSYEIEKNDFFENKKKKVYFVNNGFLSPITIDWLKRFKLRKGYSELKEFERFRNRALDIGIYDDEIISLIFQKYLGKINLNKKDDLKEEIENDKNFLESKKKINKIRDFIKKSIE